MSQVADVRFLHQGRSECNPLPIRMDWLQAKLEHEGLTVGRLTGQMSERLSEDMIYRGAEAVAAVWPVIEMIVENESAWPIIRKVLSSGGLSVRAEYGSWYVEAGKRQT